jgi:hypothetical protein
VVLLLLPKTDRDLFHGVLESSSVEVDVDTVAAVVLEDDDAAAADAMGFATRWIV